MKTITTALALASVIALAGCGQETPEATATAPVTNAKTTSSATEQAPALPEDFMLAEAPADAVSLSEARANAKTGETIAFTGYIGGRSEPFTENRALFLVADADKAPACTDGCKEPWDACCVPSDTIAANSATVQIVDANGKTLPLDLKGKNGIEPGSTVTVVGKVREANENVLIVDATGLALGSND